MSSSRFPGKALAELAGTSTIERVVGQIRAADSISDVIVTTSAGATDNVLAEHCLSKGINVFRGSLNDVAGRLLSCAHSYGAESFVRISGDSPFIDPSLIDYATGIFAKQVVDLTTNVLVRSFPKGQSVEVIRASSLQQSLGYDSSAEAQEHVTTGFYSDRADFAISEFHWDEDFSTVQLSIDTPEDHRQLEKIIAITGENVGWLELAQTWQALQGT